MTTNQSNPTAIIGQHVNFIWRIAEILRGDYKQGAYGSVLLPFTVLRRLDCLLEPTKTAVCQKADNLPEGADNTMREKMLNEVSGYAFHNTSRYTFATLLDDPDNIVANLNNMIRGFSRDVREVFIKHFKLELQIEHLSRSNLLYQIVKQLSMADLSLDRVSNLAMGHIFDELVRRLSELNNEMTGDHFTSRDVTRLMVSLLFQPDHAILTQTGITRTLYDPACGTGGMLSVAEEYLRKLNPKADLVAYGQELNDESYAICKSSRMIKGQGAENIYLGNSFTEDHLPNKQFDYLLSSPPFGLSWRNVQSVIKEEHDTLGHRGRFGPGLPRSSDGTFLFVMHMMSKFNRGDQPTRMAVVLNGSSLATGGAGSGESEIRRWIIKNDWLEAIVALPADMFYNTGIATYIWILTNQKNAARKGKIQLINATEYGVLMRKSLGSKRKQISEANIAMITALYGGFAEGKLSKIFDNAVFGYQKIAVERPLKLNFQASPERIGRLSELRGFTRLEPATKEGILALLGQLDPAVCIMDRAQFLQILNEAAVVNGLTPLKGAQLKWVLQSLSEKDESAMPCRDKKGNLEPDSGLRDYEKVPLKEKVEAYFAREVYPHVPEAWIDHSKIKVGYEISFSKLFSPKRFGKAEHAVRIKSLLLSNGAEPNVYFHLVNKQFHADDFGPMSNRLLLALDSDKVDFQYLNHYFTSQEGEEWLSYYSPPMPSWHISKNAFLNAKISLPPLEEQRRLVSLFEQLDDAKEQLSQLSGYIWEDLDKSEVLISNYSNIGAKSLNDFIYHLPYPLATLLNHAIHLIDEKDACEAYLNFFEYAAATTVCAVLGDFPVDELSNGKRKEIRPPRMSVTMGHYRKVFEKLDKYDIESNFSAAQSTFVCSEYITLLEETTKIRNEVAHTGVANRKTIADRFNNLKDLVDRFILLTREFFYQYRLIRPRYGRYLSDHYIFTVDEFSGLASAPFNKTRVKVDDPLMDGQLYWAAINDTYQSDDSCACYRAAPLLKLFEAQEDLGVEDFYFFAEIEDFSSKEGAVSCGQAVYHCPYWSISEQIFVEPSEIISFYLV